MFLYRLHRKMLVWPQKIMQIFENHRALMQVIQAMQVIQFKQDIQIHANKKILRLYGTSCILVFLQRAHTNQHKLVLVLNSNFLILSSKHLLGWKADFWSDTISQINDLSYKQISSSYKALGNINNKNRYNIYIYGSFQQ